MVRNWGIPSICVFLVLLTCAMRLRAGESAASQPATEPVAAIAPEDEGFTASEHAFGDLFGVRKQLFDRGVSINLDLIVDGSKNFMGGIDTARTSYRERFNAGITIDTDKLLGLAGGTFVAVYQLQHGGHAGHELTGDAQNFAFGTDADGRSQLGQLWYQQKLFDDTLRIKAGKMDGNADFDVLDNGADFLNNSFSTSPTLGLMPSFPDNGMGIEVFYEPKSGFYLGAGIFDGSIARGIKLGEYGPGHFLESDDDLFLIGETGLHYVIESGRQKLPGKISVGGWYDTDHFARLSGAGQMTGTGGAYLTWDQLLWKAGKRPPVPAQNPAAQIEELDYPGALASTFSVSWADSAANYIDGNALIGLAYTGLVPGRPIDVLGLGATYAHFSPDAGTRDDYELSIETFYRVRLTEWVSLKPDLQYIIHPSGSGLTTEGVRDSALVFTLRLEMTF